MNSKEYETRKAFIALIADENHLTSAEKRDVQRHIDFLETGKATNDVLTDLAFYQKQARSPATKGAT